MIEGPQRQLQTSPVRDTGPDETLSAEPARHEDQDQFLYANCALGLFSVGPLDFPAFARGQLVALAIFIPAAIALFICLAS